MTRPLSVEVFVTPTRTYVGNPPQGPGDEPSRHDAQNLPTEASGGNDNMFEPLGTPPHIA